MTAIRVIAFAILIALTPLLSVAKMVRSRPVYQNSFTLPLIHRDFPNSPLLNPKHSYYEQIRQAVSRSISRPELLSKQLKGMLDATTINNIISEGGEYLMKISIGTPRFPIMAMVDVCNSLTWTQCQPQKSRKDQRASLFDPRRSTTFRLYSRFASHPRQNTYGYIRESEWTRVVSYNKLYSSDGPIGRDTITLGGAFKFKKMEFGCKFSKRGTFDSFGSGVIGFGYDHFSIISAKFSYCLCPLSKDKARSSKIHIGENSIVSSGDDVVSTHMMSSDGHAYYLNLQAITVGKKRVTFPTTEWKSNIIIDLGTPLLMLPSTFYEAVETEIRNQVNAEPVRDPSNQLKLCYHSDGFKPPELVSNFMGGNVKLNDFNAWLATSDNVLCFAAAPSSIGIYGNLAQRNFWVEYDLDNAKVSFKPTNCSA